MNKTEDKGIRLSYFYFIKNKNKKRESNFGQTRRKKRENQIKPPDLPIFSLQVIMVPTKFIQDAETYDAQMSSNLHKLEIGKSINSKKK